jgi:hypothetical protein
MQRLQRGEAEVQGLQRGVSRRDLLPGA